MYFLVIMFAWASVVFTFGFYTCCLWFFVGAAPLNMWGLCATDYSAGEVAVAPEYLR